MAMEAVLKVGPIAAVTGLNMEEAGFRKSSWFVDLEEGEKEEGVSSKEVRRRRGGREEGGEAEREEGGRGGREGGRGEGLVTRG